MPGPIDESLDFDPTLHHVGLGTDFDDQTGLICVGPISKALSGPVFEKPANIGTDDLIGSATHSVWTQSDYTGGEFQYDYLDPAMVDEIVSMLPNQLGRNLRTVRPILKARTGEVPGWVDGNFPRSVEVIDNTLFVIYHNDLFEGVVTRYNPGDINTGVHTEIMDTSFLAGGDRIHSIAWNVDSGRFWMGSSEPRVHTFGWDDSLASGFRLVHYADLGTPDYPADPVIAIDGIHLFGAMRFIVTGHGGVTVDNNRLWLYVKGNGSSAKYTPVGVLPGTLKASVTYNNAVYFLTCKGINRTQLSMSQGDQVFPVLDFPYYFRGQGMIEYAGKLYISGVGYDFDGGETHGELYEVTGTSLRLVRTFSTEAGRPPSATQAGQMSTTPGTVPVRRRRAMTRIRCMTVAEGLLWMPDASYTGLEAYDATTDAFFGGPRYRLGHDDDIVFSDLVSFGNAIYAFGVSLAGADSKTGLYRTEKIGDDGDPYVCYMTTSDFHPSPARTKVWSEFAVMTRYCDGVSCDYSVDAGQTFTDMPHSPVSRVEGYGTLWTWDLSEIPESTRICFRFFIDRTGEADEDAAELCGHSLSFLVRGSPKKKWQFTVNASLYVAGRNDVGREQTPKTYKDFLWDLKGTEGALCFTDLDGSQWKVIISDINQTTAAVVDENEAFITLTLTEV